MPRSYLLLALIILGAYLGLAASSTVWGTDEPRFAGAGVNMVRSGNYLYATFNGEERAHKPILIYWLMSLPIQVFGPTAFACRFWSPVGTALACLLTGLIGRRLFSERAGLMAMFALALSPLMIQCGAAATVDAVLLAVIVGAMVTFLTALEHGPSWGHWALLLLTTAAAMLLKGPAALLVPVFIIPPTWWLLRRQTPLKPTYLVGVGVVLLLSVGIFLLWALPANRATAGVVLRQGISEHVVQRALQPMEQHGENRLLALPYYPLAVLAMFFPWTIFLPGAISAALGGRLGGPLVRPLLTGWTVPVLALLTVVATKLPHYALPIWPALALGVAAVVDAALNGRLAERDERWLRRGVWFMLPIGLVLGGALAAGPWMLPLVAARLPGALMGAATVAMVIAAVMVMRRGDHVRVFLVLVAGMVLFLAMAGGAMVPAMERYKIGVQLAQALPGGVPAELPIAVAGYRRSELVFSLQHDVLMLRGTEAVAEWLRQSGRGVLLLSAQARRRIEKSDGPLRLRELTRVEGLDFERMAWTTVVALERPARPAEAPATPPPAPSAPEIDE